MTSGLAARRRRRSGAIGVSVLAHAVVFVILGQNAAKLIAPEPLRSQATTLWLMPHLTALEPENKARAAASSPAAALPSASPTETSPAKALATIATPNPASNSPPKPQSGGDEARPSTAGSGAGTGLQGALRTSVGCDIGHLAHLTPEEKDRCNQRMGEEAKRGPKFIDTIPPEKRAYYDAVQQAYQAAHDPMHNLVRDRYGNIQPWGHPPGVGCGMKFGGPPQPPDHRSLADKIKATGLLGMDIGPLKCGIVIPQGSMTPEIGIPVP